MRTMPRKDLDLGLIDRLLALGIGPSHRRGDLRQLLGAVDSGGREHVGLQLCRHRDDAATLRIRVRRATGSL